MTDIVDIDVSMGLNMTEEEQEAFVQGVDISLDYGFCDFLSDEELCLYHAILQERKVKEE